METYIEIIKSTALEEQIAKAIEDSNLPPKVVLSVLYKEIAKAEHIEAARCALGHYKAVVESKKAEEDSKTDEEKED